MKATCDREKLLHAFQMAASVAPARSPKPILQNLKLEVTGGDGHPDGHRPGGGHPHRGAGLCRSQAPGSVVLPRDRFGKILTRKHRREAGLGERRPEGSGPRAAERVPAALGEPGRVSQRARPSRKRSITRCRPGSSARWSAARFSPPTTRAAATPWAAC